jgi:SprT-like family
MTRNARDIVISLLALAVIVFGIRYHMMREHLRHANLHAWYQQDNAELFGNKLPDARVEWSDLSEDNDEGKTYQLTDDSFVIVLDRNSNTSESEARDTLRHEACHVATWGEEPVHGPRWKACMSRRID